METPSKSNCFPALQHTIEHKNTTAIGGVGPTGLNPAYHAHNNYLDAYAIASDKSIHVGNCVNSEETSGDCAEPAAGDTVDSEPADKPVVKVDVTAYHVVESYNDNLSKDLLLPTHINPAGIHTPPEVVCKHDTCPYYALIDEAHGDSLSCEDPLGYGEGLGEKPIVEMKHNLLLFHLLIKVVLDPTAKVRA